MKDRIYTMGRYNYTLIELAVDKGKLYSARSDTAGWIKTLFHVRTRTCDTFHCKH